MVTHTSTGPVKDALGCRSPYVVRACSVIFATLPIFVGMEISVATPRSGAAPAVEMVNRTGKGARLPFAPELHRSAVNQPSEIRVSRTTVPDAELIEGCEPLASALTQSPLARVAGRCLS